MRLFFNFLCMVILMSFASTNAMGQGFLKLKKKAVNKEVAETPNEEANVEADQATAKFTDAQLDSLKQIKQDFMSDPGFKAVITVSIDPETGDTIRTKEGTVKQKVLMYDKDGHICDPSYIDRVISSRKKAYAKIIAKVGSGAALGAGVALLKGGNAKDAVLAGAAGAAAGLAFSVKDIKTIKQQNKTLKAYEKEIAEYRKNFNEQGEPLEENYDISSFKYLEDKTVLAKTNQEIADELAESANKPVNEIDMDVFS